MGPDEEGGQSANKIEVGRKGMFQCIAMLKSTFVLHFFIVFETFVGVVMLVFLTLFFLFACLVTGSASSNLLHDVMNLES